MFLIQIAYYAISAVLIADKLKAHAAMQEVIRCFNYNQHVRGRVKLKLRATLQPKITAALRERILEVMSDPDETVFFDGKKEEQPKGEEDSEE